MENLNNNDFNELDDIRQQLNAIKNKVDEQGHLNLRLVKEAIKGKMKNVHRTSMMLAAAGMFCIPLFIWMKYDQNLSWPLIIVTIVLMLSSIIVDYFINRIDVQRMGDDMVETARRLTKMKANRSKSHRISLTVAMLWLLWFIYEFYKSHLALGEMAARMSVIPIIVGATIGATLGVFLYHRMQCDIDEMIRQINDVNRDQ
jgi:uncharacterized protein YqgC (DUF456 family)